MIIPVSRLVRPVLFSVLTFSAFSALAQTIPTEGKALVQCGTSYYKANIPAEESDVVTFENASANAICGNEPYSSFATAPSDSSARRTLPLSSIESFNNDNFANVVVAHFNPGLKRVLKVGETDVYACDQQLGNAAVIDIQRTGYVSLKYQDQELENRCGQDRYQYIQTLMNQTVHLQKSGPTIVTLLYSLNGYFQCGNNYYAASLNSFEGSEFDTLTFVNPNAQAVCGNSRYDHVQVQETRGFIGTAWGQFIERTKSPGLLDDKTFKRGQILPEAPCKNTLAPAQVVGVDSGHGLVALRFQDPQLDALCGQGRYVFSKSTIPSIQLPVVKIVDRIQEIKKQK